MRLRSLPLTGLVAWCHLSALSVRTGQWGRFAVVLVGGTILAAVVTSWRHIVRIIREAEEENEGSTWRAGGATG